jgi:hypothetical protein
VDNIEWLQQQGDKLFSDRFQLMSLWQTVAENFYPERADFTYVRNIGIEFARNLLTSYPIMARRDLGNSFSTMLRPTSLNWFHARLEDWDKVDSESRAWLEWSEGIQRRAMFDRASMFSRATKEGDHDFAAFGQAVLQTSLNRNGNGLLYRCWHLRDVVWREGQDGGIDTIYRKWKPHAIDLQRLFPKTISDATRRTVEKDPYQKLEVWHCVIPSDQYQGSKKYRTPYVSIYYDTMNKCVLEEVGAMELGYIVPRWQTVSGSQYAYSPATVAALPDARLIQSMTRVLLEAGEKAVTPPMLAVQQAIRGDVSLFAGGITWVDSEYDERLGEVLRPLTQNLQGMPLGFEMQKDIRQMIAEAFFLNKITLPQPGNDMTAYEVGQRVQEYIRQAMPLFEPMETDYNAPLCENTFNLLMRNGAFGSPYNLPKGLRGREIVFNFESPLHDAAERAKGQRYLEMGSMLAQTVQVSPESIAVIDFDTAFRDVLQATGIPAKWTRSEMDAKKIIDQQKQKQQAAEMLAGMQQGATVTKTLAEAGQGGMTTVNQNRTTQQPTGNM